jgi:alpha-beta hydrolase superfamily lysophospholipase
MNMESSEWKWTSTDNLSMYSRKWAPKENIKAAILLVHGLGEHIGRYEHVASALSEKGYAMLGFDLRGHGKCGGPRGHIPSYEALMDDITCFFHQVDEKFAGLPRFLYGHSLGGNLVLNYALRCKPDLKGVIATGPWLKLAFEPPTTQISLGKLMNRIAPGFTQHSKLDTKGLSHDQTIVSAYENDPLVHDKISARLFVEIYESGLWALEHAAEFQLPLLLMHGGSDPITSAQASQEFANKAGDKVTFQCWENMYHEIHNEPEKGQVFTYMLNWLDKHL